MIKSLIIAVGGIVSLMVIWAVVQFFWGKTFSDYTSDEDVLAGRNSCGNCGCTTTACENKRKQVLTK